MFLSDLHFYHTSGLGKKFLNVGPQLIMRCLSVLCAVGLSVIFGKFLQKVQQAHTLFIGLLLFPSGTNCKSKLTKQLLDPCHYTEEKYCVPLETRTNGLFVKHIYS